MQVFLQLSTVQTWMAVDHMLTHMQIHYQSASEALREDEEKSQASNVLAVSVSAAKQQRRQLPGLLAPRSLGDWAATLSSLPETYFVFTT